MARKHFFLTFFALLVVAIIGIGLFTFKPFGFMASDQEIASKVKTLYELVNPGVTFNVIKTEQISGMYKISLSAVDSAGQSYYREAYVSKDGKLLTESMILVSESINQVARINKFADCLREDNVRVLGISNQTATQLQFNILGGSYAASKLYVSCDGDLAQQCVNAGITQVPSVVHGSKAYPGVYQIGFFENLTQCKY